MKIRFVVILVIAILAPSERLLAHASQPADVKSQAQKDSAASTPRHVTEGAQRDAKASQNNDNETLVVDLPFSFVEIDPALAEYLSLTSRQKRAVQRLVLQQRVELEPLKAQLESTHERLVAAVDRSQSKEIEILAAEEARILTKLIIKSSRILARLSDLLTPAQRKKLEELNVVLKER